MASSVTSSFVHSAALPPKWSRSSCATAAYSEVLRKPEHAGVIAEENCDRVVFFTDNTPGSAYVAACSVITFQGPQPPNTLPHQNAPLPRTPLPSFEEFEEKLCFWRAVTRKAAAHVKTASEEETKIAVQAVASGGNR